MNKYQRYVAKCVSEGRCPHCGKPCTPYYECADRRMLKKVGRSLRRMEQAGLVRKEWRGRGFPAFYYHTGKKAELVCKRPGRPNDSRLWPKINDRPTSEDDVGRFFVAVLRGRKDGMTETELMAAFAKKRIAASKRMTVR